METQRQQDVPLAPAQLWTASAALSPRVRRLREEYFSFYTRDFTNEVRAYTTGTLWDMVYSIWQWSNVPEVARFSRALLVSPGLCDSCRTAPGVLGRAARRPSGALLP
jgi:hypothetical protein